MAGPPPGPPSDRAGRFRSLRSGSFGWRWLRRLAVVVALAAGVWRFVVMPQWVERLYGQGAAQFQAGDVARAIQTLERAHALNARERRVNLLLAKIHERLTQIRQAESYFALAYAADPSSEEARRGLALTRLALDQGAAALPLFKEMALDHPNDKQTQMWLGEALIKSGQNLKAAQAYKTMLERDPADYNARQAFLALYGYPEFRSTLSLTPTLQERPEQLQAGFRTQGDFFQVRAGETWKNIYLTGVNLGPARPGEFPSTASRDYSTYLEWFRQIGELHANTVRIYTILPPAFYLALKEYNLTASAPLWLIQEVWIHDQAENLYEPDVERQFREDLQHTIDLIHGNADVGYRRGFNYGIYTADVSRFVLALAVGREIEPRIAQITNAKNPTRTSHKGRYVSIEKGNPVEAWFARMCDLAVGYEVQKYNAQRPLTVVNWPPLDPMTHASESTFAEELRIRKSKGEAVSNEPLPFMNDTDVVSLDIVKFKQEPEFVAGLFALFHVYQHWPDFLYREPSYAEARDAQGPNRYLGYLQELKKAHPNLPLLIGEYGLATSQAAAHLHPEGWNNGGLTEKQQADLLVRFTKNIQETGCAGGVAFEWQDEWFKHVHDYYTADFEQPWERNPLWRNTLDPEKAFGLVGYEPAVPAPLLRGEHNDWLRAEQLYALEGLEPGVQRAPGELWAVYAYADFAYFYILLDVEPSPIDWSTWHYWIALNTLPGQSGSRLLPEIGVRLETGANFLVQLTGPTSSRILIAENYDPNRPTPTPGRPDLRRIMRRQSMAVELTDAASFREILTEANEPRYARDGRFFPALNFNRSPFPMGSADREKPGYSSHALWNADPKQGMIELRIPWGLLLLTDPSSRQAFAGTDDNRTPISRATPGISVAAFVVRPQSRGPIKTVANSMPALGQARQVRTPRVYTWEKWDRVEYRAYFKASYFALQKTFAELAKSVK